MECMGVPTPRSITLATLATPRSRQRRASGPTAIPGPTATGRVGRTGRPGTQFTWAVHIVSATPEEFLARFRSLAALSGTPGVSQAGSVHDPPVLEDFLTVSLPKETVDALRTCRPGNCDVKLPADALRQVLVLQGNAAPLFQVAADSLIESLALELAQIYAASGDSALPPYMGKGTPAAPGTGMSTLLAGRTPLLDLFPGLPERLSRPGGFRLRWG